MKELHRLNSKIVQWHHDRNLIKGSTNLQQLTKLREEVDELEASLQAGTSGIDDYGDICVVLIGMAEREGLSLESCLAHAYEDIKNRKGYMNDEGIFVKEQ
jgi:hypothetical protein